LIIILMGVSGSGKTTIGKLLAGNLGWDFYDGDDFHSPANIAKMSGGTALTDEDRQPWLQSLRELITRCIDREEPAVIACSALKKSYRIELRVNETVRFVYLKGSFAQLEKRLNERQNHFMTSELLADQFATLEEPEDALKIDVSRPPAEIVSSIRTAFGI